ncbi:mitochondrial mRNA pseudouridine synthase Trub2 [Copidosoma floridanum]|uniref:mitochondrial mRNA pseudouridine synthase Trub2 n=1 Tax=Copidosoma floridanum TaxID=29053 RepID=UPI0006C9591B|nr:mitochondrial mRNA pseudouridine synthase Trub2 [Copidosoma floridanum]
MTAYTRNAQLVWNVLNGVFNIYKPSGVHPLTVRSTIISNLCRDLNELDVRPPMEHVSIEGPTNKEMRVTVRNSYADHPLVVGPRYLPDNFKMAFANKLPVEASGVMICGVNSGTALTYKLKQACLTKFYRVKGILGQARVDNYITGSILEKATWKKVKRGNIDRICAAVQAAHQKKMFENSGIDIQSQEAFDLAAKGLIRPADQQIPTIYSIKCVDFKPPEFTLEIVCINEDNEYLKSLVSEIGYRVKSVAHCSYIQCSQFGHFNVKNSLLSKHWDLQNILDSVSQCHRIIKENPYMIKQEHANLVPAQAVAQQ